jgi:hypothetical protein
MERLTDDWTLWILIICFVLSLVLLVLCHWNIPRRLWQPQASYLSALDRRILQMIATLEIEGRAMTARNVWGFLTDDSVEQICERLILLERTGYIAAEIGPKQYVGGTASTLRDGDIHGLTEKGRATLQISKERRWR